MKIHPTEDMHVLSMARRLTIPEVASAAAELSTAIEAERARAGLAAAGPWTFLAQNLPRDGKTAFDWRICLPVAGAAAYGGPLEVLHLEPIMVASALHLGPVRTLFTQGYAPLLRAIGETRHHLSGQSREVYHDWRGGKAGYNRIEIQFELSR